MPANFEITSKSLAAAFTRNFIRDTVDFRIHNYKKSESTENEESKNDMQFEYTQEPSQNKLNKKNEIIEIDNSIVPTWKSMSKRELFEDFVNKMSLDTKMEIQTDLFNKSYFINEMMYDKFSKVVIDTELLSKYEEPLKNSRYLEKSSLFSSKESVQGKELIDDERKKELEKKKPKVLEDWGNMEKQKLTPEIELQLKAFKLAHAAKGGSDALEDELTRKDLPKFFQFGTLIDHATDYYSRKGKKRKNTLLDDMLEEQKESKYVKERYEEIQKKLHKESRKRQIKRRKIEK